MTKVLVVEDMPSEMAFISSLLREAGYMVIEALGAKEALEKISQYKPDVVITDVVMPEMSGFELCRALKKNPETEKLPVVVCSSKNQELDRLWAMKQGADAYVTKPFTRDDLVRALKSVVM
ncbi:MAG: response regulator [Thermosynechococcus sp. Uc]|uniref:response regulator n=1 Tax=Thermosynechococcus sp. Uc TaxID=3034853 RepID=UPI0019FA4846|nr:response regulator [Thermosynechococcus sp. Uc]MDM7327560.1 response regulator [Thermosynechococcus sp. Uc]HIK24498.1 response regulator [Thermosynechococcus sp. M46_R2017_013]